MNLFHSLTGSWGLSIILLTVVLRLMLYPLNAWSARSMLKMQEIAPKVQAIQEKYKNDPKKSQLEIMNLYRESGANPFSGCFPILIQIPFLLGMFTLLKTTSPSAALALFRVGSTTYPRLTYCFRGTSRYFSSAPRSICSPLS